MAITIDGTNGLTSDNAALKLDGTTLVVDDTNNSVGIGTSNTPSNKDTVTPKLVVNGSGVAGSMQVVRNTTPGGGGAILELTATRGSDVNSYTILQSGDGVGSVVFGGADGNEFVPAASIVARVDGTPGDNDMPGRLVFNTTADGASSATERMRLTSDGYLRMASGTGGIQFGGDTAAANALDDYEEGTFTPTISGASSAGSASYNIQQGTYTKVGRIVTVSLRIEVTSFTGTGALQVNGFPFATAQLSPLSMEYIAPVMTNGMNWTGGSQVVYYMPPNATYGNIFYIADDAAWGVQQCVNESFNIIVTMTYVTT